ncbi:baseplate J/gp47 family protein [Kocuria sp. M1R5S2]|uniref:baseplate J/gp47 family protein n=1 Tax=Kocuria rhizosphaerae TaxID=3376285 RepID=UPI003787F24E
MSRTPAQVLAAMAAAGRLVAYDDAATWADVLFGAGPDGLPSPEGEPDRELLAALAGEYALLDEHAATLSASTRRAWLEDVLGIGRLPALPDRVVAHASVDPKLAPAVVPRGTLLRGGKDAAGNERRYRTLDALTAHGAVLTGVRSLVPGGTAAGLPGVAASAPDFPLRPAAGPDAPHVLRVSSPALAFEGGDLDAVLAFTGATGVAGLAGAVWRCSRADGTVSPTLTGTVAGSSVTVTLPSGCGAPEGTSPWLECVVPPTVPVPEDLSFTGVTVRIARRSPYVPEAAFYNDGAVDVTKEFQPYGAVAKRGDAFYVRSDEAFGKKLATVDILVTILQEGGAPLSASAGGSGIPDRIAKKLQDNLRRMRSAAGEKYPSIADEWESVYGAVSETSTPTVRWQRRVGSGWTDFGTASSSFGTVSATIAGSAVASEPFAVSGQAGHYVRAFLAAGDFGWTAYQQDVADFATQAVAGTTPTPTMPVVPVPPIASELTVRYTTSPVAASRVEARSGWRRQVQPATGTFRPFRRAVSATGAPAMVALGLDLPDAAVGSSVSLWFEIDSAAPCGSSEPVAASWQWWDGSAWAELAVADGTGRLRESGLLRFVVPAGWPPGCPDTAAATGRWIRLVTDQPDRLGDVRDLVLDAVVAEFVSAAAEPALDPSSATALPPGTVKGALTPIRGVKKVTNVASVRGRGPEQDHDYLERASARTRHRGRALTPWDYEQLVALSFPEVAAVLCLPHTDRTGAAAPGSVGLVVVPDRPLDPRPRPSVSLSGRVVDALGPLRPMGAAVHVLCPEYVPVTVVAEITLRRGIAALTGKEAVISALEAVLHPTGTTPVRWGRPLYASTLVAFLERLPVVDVVTSFALHDAGGAAVEQVAVDPCRGLYCSGTDHRLTCEEQL